MVRKGQESSCWFIERFSGSPGDSEPPGRAAAHGPNRVDDGIDLVCAHRGKERQADQARPDSRRGWQIGRTPAKRLRIVGMEVQRTPVHRARHSRLGQLTDEAIAIDRQDLETQADRKQMPCVDAVHGGGRQFELLNIAQSLKVFLRDRFASTAHLLGAGKLMYADGGSDVVMLYL